MQNTDNTTVERELELKLVLSPERAVPVPARLAYRTDDPYAVHITFHIGTDHPVNWTFARELLVEGVFRACGHGDVRIWPTKVDGRGVILMALSSPDGDALLEAPPRRCPPGWSGPCARCRRAPRPSGSASTTDSPNSWRPP